MQQKHNKTMTEQTFSVSQQQCPDSHQSKEQSHSARVPTGCLCYVAAVHHHVFGTTAAVQHDHPPCFTCMYISVASGLNAWCADDHAGFLGKVTWGCMHVASLVWCIMMQARAAGLPGTFSLPFTWHKPMQSLQMPKLWCSGTYQAIITW